MTQQVEKVAEVTSVSALPLLVFTGQRMCPEVDTGPEEKQTLRGHRPNGEHRP